MPNHFHMMVHVNFVKLAVKEEDTDSLTQSETISKTISTSSETISIPGKKPPKLRSFNDSIGIMLRTYARAIQKQEKMEGSLFQQHTKGSCLTNPDENDFSWFYEDYELQDNDVLTREEYPTVCFKYIHNNPVKACLCKSIIGWEFSSAPDYFAGRKGKLIHKERAREYSLY
jgi:putative transposase